MKIGLIDVDGHSGFPNLALMKLSAYQSRWAIRTTGKPHPQMLQVTIPLLNEFKRRIPVVFDDLVVEVTKK